LTKHPENLTDSNLAEIAQQIMRSLAYLADNCIAHRDIKLENIIMTPNGVIKMLDFGMAACIDREVVAEVCGSPGYMAPELLAGEPYGLTVDMFSLGVVMY
jgi:serine/threonine protein kinase